MGDKSSIIRDAYYGPGGLREMALAAVRKYRDQAKEALAINEVPDLAEYAQAVCFRNLVFSMEPGKAEMSWESALNLARITASSQLAFLASPNRSSNPYEEAKARSEMAAVLAFLAKTRALML